MNNYLSNPKKMTIVLPSIDENEVRDVDKREEADGIIYSGQMKIIIEGGEERWLKHGFGTQLWPDLTKYVGDWRDDFATGRGTFYYKNGDIYIGEFLKDKANGYGAFIHENGNRYEGFWRDDVQEGEGTEELEDGSKYEG